MKKGVIKSFGMFVLVLTLIFPLLSAGVGISWDRESSLVPENTKTCLTYKVYNPWDADVYAKIGVSENFNEIITSGKSEVKLIPAYTSSSEAMPVQFCFKTPRVYERDCLLLDSLICKQDCTEEMKVFSGEVEVLEVSESEFKGTGSGGSATQMSVSAPLKVRVQCLKHDRNYSFIYLVVAFIAAILLALNFIKKGKSVKGKKYKAKGKK